MHRTGFTLIELVTVIVILGILATVATPIYLDYRTDAYMAVAKGIEGSLKSARNLYIGATRMIPKSFWAWVAFSDGGSALNTMRIDSSIRSQLADPNGDVCSSNGKTLTLKFKNGLQAVFTIDDNGTITSTYTNP